MFILFRSPKGFFMLFKFTSFFLERSIGGERKVVEVEEDYSAAINTHSHTCIKMHKSTPSSEEEKLCTPSVNTLKKKKNGFFF